MEAIRSSETSLNSDVLHSIVSQNILPFATTALGT
jgi:hypothetical protein